EKKVSDRHSGTFNALVRAYLTSIEFENLAEPTQKEYKRLLTAAEAEFGDLPIAALNEPEVRQEFLDWHEKVARTSGPRAGDYCLQTISAILTWAVKHGKIQTNHLKGNYTRLYHVDRSQIIWTQEHIDRFMTVAP